MNAGFLFFIQLVVSGIALGCLYALIAIGFVLILKATDIMNFAQGEVIMLSAFICYFLVTTFHIPFLAAVLLTGIAAGLMGIVTERLILRPMLGEPVFAVVMVTIGLSIFLRSMAGILFGHNNLVFPSPFPREAVKMGGIVLSQTEIWIMLSSLVLVTVFFLFFKYSRMGLAMRGTADDQDVALLMGISVKQVFALIWAVSFATAAASGVFLANVMVINLGLSSVAISAFPAIILGGLESIPGAIIGGLAIGIIENLAGGYLDQVIGGGVKDVTPFVVLFLVLMIRPYGLFGKKEIERV
ncbi:MAG: branched-chain amino acid ABC transporter permease [Desulfatiglans sp.]|jgi:branched-chain amino acid transport system permease protein|nr:branched-chain amino acid ABC transporter permease [Thermodesulfobacteriota bacterium]MEE4353118.1 branched-chain amino acid ABC transporter permease [Desulfatiglans sp.]